MKQNAASRVGLKKQKCEMADWAIAMAVPSNGHPLRRYNVSRSNRLQFESTFEYLLSRGCDRKALITALWIANTIRVEPLPTGQKVKMVAKRMRELAEKIEELEKTQFNILQIRSVVAQSGMGPEEVDDISRTFPHLALSKWLRKGAELYDEWLTMASKKVPPRRELLLRVKRVCPVIYVKMATGRPYCEKISKLLHLAGITRISKEQLSREVLAFEADYPAATWQIRMNLSLVHKRVWTYRAPNSALTARSASFGRTMKGVPKS